MIYAELSITAFKGASVRSICIKGYGYLASTLAVWIRRLSPRSIIALEYPVTTVLSPRYLCGLLKGQREGVSFSERFFKYLVYPYELWDHACDARVTVKEPHFPFPYAEKLSLDQAVIFPPTPLGVQLALCAAAQTNRILVEGEPDVFSSGEMSSLLIEKLVSKGLLGEGEGADLFSDLSVEAEITIEKADGSSATFRSRVFLDEVAEGLAAAAALEMMGRRYLPPLEVIIIDAGEDVLFEVGDQRGESSSKIGLEDSTHFVRLVLSRGEGRVVGARGMVPRQRFPAIFDALLALLTREGFCEHLPTFAFAKSTILSGCSVLRGLLGLAARLCF